jgi:DNA-binding NarL/FixJ family response regulator
MDVMKQPGKRPTVPLRARIAILSEHPLICGGVRECLKASREFAFAGELSDAREVRSFIAMHRPDLLLLDLSPPTSLCFTTLKDLAKLFPLLPMLILSTEDESLYAERGLQAGAKGYVMEQGGCGPLMEAIRCVLSEQLYLSRDLAQMILRKTAGQGAQSASGPLDILTEREFDIFQLIGHAKATREIAARLYLSPKTVAVHRNHIRNKLRLRTGAELVQFAIRFCEGQSHLKDSK